MNSDYLKLTAYFGERQRIGGRFTVDALLALFAADGVATSVVLRGIAGFGPRHVLRTDVTLSLSEDPPITVTAVDTVDRMEALAPRVLDLVDRGLVTLERARRLEDAGDSPWTQLTVYLGRGSAAPSGSVYPAVGEVLRAHGMAAATGYAGVDGTVAGRRRRAGFFSRNLDVPSMILAVGPHDAARQAATHLEADPRVLLVTADPAHLRKVAGERITPATPVRAGSPDVRRRLVVHTAASDLHDGLPVHRALVRALRDVEPTAGVTVLHGVWGFQGDGPPLTDRMFQTGRRAPVTTIMIDTPDRIEAAFAVVDGLTPDHGVVSTGAVPAAVSIDSGQRRGSLRYDL